MSQGLTKTPLFVRKQSGGMFSVVDESQHPGNIWWVDSGNAAASDTAGFGRNPDAPFATIDYAVGNCTANNGDVIYVMPGHAETKSVTGSLLAMDVAGISVVGLGKGADRPTLTFSHTGATMTISAASVRFENVLLVCGVDSVTTPLTISATDATLKDVEIRDAANVEFITGITTTNAADRLHVDGLQYRGDVATGDACLVGIGLAGCDDVLIENCIFDGIAATAFINFSVAVDNVHVRNCVFNNVGTALTKNVVDTATGSTWDVMGCFDLVGGYAFSGGSGNALATDDVSALAAAVAVVDEFHDVPAANNTLNAQINEVIGNKTDTAAAGAVTSTDTLVAYIKQLVTDAIAATAAIGVIDEFHDVPAADNVLNAQINEVIGNKTDAAAAGAVTGTDTLVAYIKQLVTDAIAATAAIGVIDEFHDVPAVNNVLNAQVNEVIGNKEDAVAAGDVTTTDTLVAYIKQIVSEMSGTTGVATWPSAAAPASGVSLAEALRYLSENQLPRVASHVKADVTAAVAWTTGNSPITLFTVTGDVLVKCFATIQTKITTTAANGTLELGVVGDTASLLVQDVADGTAFDAGDAWTLISAADDPSAQLADEWTLLAGGADIVLTVATNSTTAGAATVYCQYIPISTGASVVTT